MTTIFGYTRRETKNIRLEMCDWLRYLLPTDDEIYSDVTRAMYSVLWYGLPYEEICRQHGVDPDDDRRSLRAELPGPALQCVAEAEWQAKVDLSFHAPPMDRDEVLNICKGSAQQALYEFERVVGVTV
mgnify:CR=1 FL=1